jgi:hypothetical protein
MKFPLSILAAIWIGAPLAHAEESKNLDLANQPTFGLLKASGLRFVNPLGSGGAYKAYLAAESARQSWSIGSKSLGPIEVSSALAYFARADFTEPGKYYPPLPPIEDRTPVARLELKLAAVKAGEMAVLAPKLSEFFGLDLPKIATWLDLAAKLPESTKDLQMEGKVGGKPCEVTFFPPDETGAHGVSLGIEWFDPDNDPRNFKRTRKPGVTNP